MCNGYPIFFISTFMLPTIHKESCCYLQSGSRLLIEQTNAAQLDLDCCPSVSCIPDPDCCPDVACSVAPEPRLLSRCCWQSRKSLNVVCTPDQNCYLDVFYSTDLQGWLQNQTAGYQRFYCSKQWQLPETGTAGQPAVGFWSHPLLLSSYCPLLILTLFPPIESRQTQTTWGSRVYMAKSTGSAV